MGRADIRRPITHRFADGILERAASRVNPRHSCTEQSHPEDIERLTSHVFGPHIDFTLKPEQRSNSRRRHPMLSGPGFSDNARLLHSPGQESLPDRIIDFVSPGMTEIFAL